MSWEVSLQAVDTSDIGKEVLEVKKSIPEWVDDIIKYLETKNFPTSREEVRKVRSRATQFTMIDGTLYK